MLELRDQSVLVLGLGISGLSMARWCARQGAIVHVADSRANPPQREALRAAVPDAVVRTGGGIDLPDGMDCVCVSPGIAPSDPAFGPLLNAAREANVRVCGELDLFMAALRELHRSQGYAPAVLAITGTNGKTTVTTLTAQLLNGAGIDAVAAGNIGPALLDTLSERLDESRLPQAWVLELSSFQLHGVTDFVASAATVLNVTQDHLDWHGSMDAYASDKARIFGPEPLSYSASERSDSSDAHDEWPQPRLMLLNRDDPSVMAMMRKGRMVQTFGLDVPVRTGDWGVVVDHGMAWLARAHGRAEEVPSKRRSKAVPVQESAPALQLLMPADALRIRGRHNWANALAALALAASVGAPLGPMLHALRNYAGEPHRMQSLGVIKGVEWIEDSKGTNVGATAAALAGLERPVVLIAGGDGKGQDFAPLAQAARGRVRSALLIGRDARRIQEALRGVCPSELVQDLRQAVTRAAELAESGDVVLLSPACASLDMFRNYAHRAEVFSIAVAELAREHGVLLEGVR